MFILWFLYLIIDGQKMTLSFLILLHSVSCGFLFALATCILLPAWYVFTVRAMSCKYVACTSHMGSANELGRWTHY